MNNFKIIASKPKRLFHIHAESTKETLKNSNPEKIASDNLFKNDEIKFPVIMSGSIAND